MAYLALLVLLGSMALATAAASFVGSQARVREKEKELLWVGAQYRAAIGEYYFASPQQRRYPRGLDELLLDRRFPGVRRYLRRPYPDPMTGETGWGLVRAPDGGVMGVYSLAAGRPIRRAGWDSTSGDAGDATSYSDWKFVYVPPR